jgi:hypothetical protein
MGKWMEVDHATASTAYVIIKAHKFAFSWYLFRTSWRQNPNNKAKFAKFKNAPKEAPTTNKAKLQAGFKAHRGNLEVAPNERTKIRADDWSVTYFITTEEDSK